MTGNRPLTLKDIGIISIAGVLDWHANFLIVKAYSYTTITSVMILMVFTVPSAVLLSIIFLRVRYSIVHYISSVVSILAVIAIVLWDIFESDSEDNTSKMNIILGDLFWIAGVFLLASTNVYQEWLLFKGYEVHQIIAFLAPAGILFAVIEAWIVGEFKTVSSMENSHILPSIAFYAGFAGVNFILYSFIPVFISMAGATLMNIGNLTASVYSMIFDIFLFNGQFKWFYLIGFTFQILSIVLFSLKDPINPNMINEGKIYFL